MKRRWKIFWTVCGITAAIGLACCIAALALGVTAEMIEGRFPLVWACVRRENEQPGILYRRAQD